MSILLDDLNEQAATLSIQISDKKDEEMTAEDKLAAVVLLLQTKDAMYWRKQGRDKVVKFIQGSLSVNELMSAFGKE